MRDKSVASDKASGKEPDEPPELCWGCQRDLAGELITHPYKVKEDIRERGSPFKNIVYTNVELCDECLSKKRNI